MKYADWPIMMRKPTAAAYLDLSVAAFEREVAVGTLPQPIELGGRWSWSRQQINAAIDRLTGEALDDWRKHTLLYQALPDDHPLKPR